MKVRPNIHQGQRPMAYKPLRLPYGNPPLIFYQVSEEPNKSVATGRICLLTSSPFGAGGWWLRKGEKKLNQCTIFWINWRRNYKVAKVIGVVLPSRTTGGVGVLPPKTGRPTLTCGRRHGAHPSRKCLNKCIIEEKGVVA